MRWIKQSTAQTFKTDPITDSAGAPLTSLTIQKADVRLAKNNGDMAAASADQGTSDAGAPHDELGVYNLSLDTTDTNTLGPLKIVISESGALVYWEDCAVVSATVYDALMGSSFNTIVRSAVYDATAATYDAENSMGALLNDILPNQTNIYGVVNSGTHGNAALKTLIDTIDNVVDQILADTGTDGVVVAAGSKSGYSLTQSFPSNFASLGINASGHISRVTLADTVTTLTGHTAQTGDAYARIGANGAGLTALPWNASWDAEVESEVTDALNTYDPPTNAELEARTVVAANYLQTGVAYDINASGVTLDNTVTLTFIVDA